MATYLAEKGFAKITPPENPRVLNQSQQAIETQEPQVFISHSSKDDGFVNKLLPKLKAKGINLWVDHENIQPGQDWDTAIEDALKTSKSMVLVVSTHSIASDSVKREWSFFLEEQKPIFPIEIEACELPVRLRLHQKIDFTTDIKNNTSKLAEALLKE